MLIKINYFYEVIGLSKCFSGFIHGAIGVIFHPCGHFQIVCIIVTLFQPSIVSQLYIVHIRTAEATSVL